MPKWKSPIFSDIRNAIGNNVVFSQWKGRPFFRSYVVPANPNTLAQQAERLNNTDVLKRYQALSTDGDVKAAWNLEALPELISGANMFMKYGRMSKIKSSVASGSAPLDLTLTYTCGIPLAKACIFQLKGSTWSILKDVGTLESGEDKTVAVTGLTADTYYWFIADKNVLVPGDSAPQDYQAVTKWYPNHVTGLNDECKCVVS